MIGTNMMFLAVTAVAVCLCLQQSQAFTGRLPTMTRANKLMMSSTIVNPTTEFAMSDNKNNNNNKPEEKTGWERLKAAMEDNKDPKKKKGPPIYQPGPYQYQVLAALAYVIPIVDSADLSKYMFEAYPSVGAIYNTLFGPLSAIYNGVPFLPFAVFFVMSYISRAPTFPVEVRFHFAQAFMVSLIQFIPSLTFGFLEKAGVPGMAVAYNTGKADLMICCRLKNIFFLLCSSFLF